MAQQSFQTEDLGTPCVCGRQVGEVKHDHDWYKLKVRPRSPRLGGSSPWP